MNNNQLDGNIPATLADLSALEELNLAHNQLSGSVPSELSLLKDLNLLYLDNNLFSGELPSQLGQIPNLQQVSVWDNNMTWADSYENGILADTVALVAIHDAFLTSWWRDNNYWMTYSPLDIWGDGRINTAGGRVTELNLSNLSQRLAQGKLPPEIGLLAGLRVLNLSGTPELDGELPATIGNLSNLTELNISNSGISGEIPAELGNLSSVKTYTFTTTA